MKENKVLPLPIIELFVEPGIYEAELEDGTKMTITNPIFAKQIYVGSNYYYSLYGWANDEKITMLNVTYDTSLSNHAIQGKVYKYKTIEVFYTLTKTDFPCEKLNFEDTYRAVVRNELMDNIIGINKIDETKGILYIGYETYGKDFWVAGPMEYIVKEDFVAELEDGTTINYAGKKVIFAQTMKYENFEVETDRLDPLGYIEGNKLILFDVSVSERDESGIAIKFNSIELEKDGELQLD